MKQILLFSLFLISFLVTGIFCIKKTDKFSLLKIRDNFPAISVEAPALSPEEAASIKKILSQPFFYYKRGAQSFTFLSDDGRYVLKVLNNRLTRQINLLNYLPFSSAKRE